VTGNLKFDIQIPHEQINKGKEQRLALPHSSILIAASTHANEEEQIIELFARLRADYPNLLLIIVPRHPYRFDEVALLCQRKGYEIARRSLQEMPTSTTQIYLGDTMGELYFYYALADIAFVGGSLVPAGGHNLLEPAGVKLPIVTGPHLHNFAAISGLLAEKGSLFIAATVDDLYKITQNLLADSTLRHTSGENGFQVLVQNQGAASNHLQVVRELLPSV
jgi:3-deoxy-D-manno-octulosonic-acid transferase